MKHENIIFNLYEWRRKKIAKINMITATVGMQWLSIAVLHITTNKLIVCAHH